MRAEEIKGLMEAYSHVYETPEVLSEEVVEEDLEQLMERGAPTDPKARAAYDANVAKNRAALGNTLLYGNAAGRKPEAPITRNRNVRGGGVIKPSPTAAPKTSDSATKSKFAGARDAAFAKAKQIKGSPVVGSAPAAPKLPAPSSTTPTKSSTSTPTKPSTPTAPTKPAGSAMDQWAKANPKLAAAKAERDRTRGTSATTNPLMKDMKSRLPAPKSPAPSTAKTGFDLAKKGVNLASDVDLFDIVKGYLLDEGYAESEDAAMVIMVNMSEGWKESILESCGVELELDESQHARENPEEYERSSEAKEGRRKRSGINDPDTGINSDKFKAFMAKQMGGKKKKD